MYFVIYCEERNTSNFGWWRNVPGDLAPTPEQGQPYATQGEAQQEAARVRQQLGPLWRVNVQREFEEGEVPPEDVDDCPNCMIAVQALGEGNNQFEYIRASGLTRRATVIYFVFCPMCGGETGNPFPGIGRPASQKTPGEKFIANSRRQGTSSGNVTEPGVKGDRGGLK